MRFTLLMVFIFLFICACALKQDIEKTSLTVNMYNSSGDQLGTAKLAETAEGVEIKLKVEGLTPGFHGFHVHEYAKCTPPTFKSAGNHLNPDNKEHGLLHPKGSHLGDLPNIEVDHEGKADGTFLINGATLLQNKRKSLTNNDGTSLIITSEPDDGMTQITGNSGDRIICGEIKMAE